MHTGAAHISATIDNLLEMAYVRSLHSNHDQDRALWLAVLRQAKIDAMSNINRKHAKDARKAARVWLTNNSEGYKLVCEYAGCDGEMLRRAFEALFIGHDADQRDGNVMLDYANDGQMAVMDWL